MSAPHDHDRPATRPAPGSGARDALRDLRDSAVEALVGVVVFVVVVFGLGLLGSAVAGTTGFVLGVLAGLVVVGVAWVVLLVTGSLAGLRLLLRRRG